MSVFDSNSGKIRVKGELIEPLTCNKEEFDFEESHYWQICGFCMTTDLILDECIFFWLFFRVGASGWFGPVTCPHAWLLHGHQTLQV